ncbi:MAG TPA: polysaccharide ABC transporter ATP-binding protein, partial [Thermoanaerobaculia bacterium]
MGDAVVTHGISKQYRLGEIVLARNLLRERLAAAFRAPFKRNDPDTDEEFWALRDVSVTIREGEIVALIGKNGAGKSTLLKILSEITEPTEGEAHIFGKVASLLEVGIGFHPELSGRENIYLNGAILGMSREETRSKFDDIVAFSEVERFIDTPVKRYSSGMYVRLAFAVAAHLDPDILIIDEVLAVGDLAFQQKCLRKLRNVREQGRTVIVVSHSMSTVTSLCERAIWLHDGKVRAAGPAAEIVSRYVDEGIQNDVVWQPRHASHAAFEYHSVAVVRADNDQAADSVPANVGVDIVFDFSVVSPLPPGRLFLRVHNEYGETLFTSTSADRSSVRGEPWRMGRQKMRCRIPANLLMPGRYSVSVSHPFGGYDVLHDNIVTFTINEQNALIDSDLR